MEDLNRKTQELQKVKVKEDIKVMGDYASVEKAFSEKKCDDLVREGVELVIPPPPSAASLVRFMCQLGKRLNNDNGSYNCASIVHTVGSWNRGAVISLTLRATTLVALLKRLEIMPEVEKVEEEPLLAGDDLSSFHKKFGFLSSSNISHSNRVRVTLKEIGTTRQGLVNVLN